MKFALPKLDILLTGAKTWLNQHKKALLAGILFFAVTASFLWPMFSHVTNYSEGGDHMFNAWTLARNHHCLLGQGCDNYSDGNIFFPHKDTMLYSETQFSTGLLTLPFHFINDNPLFAVNMWYLLSVFFSGLFMYLLVSYLSKGNQPLSILAGLLFQFAPTKISAMSHLQNLSIFYLPLIILLLLKYRDTGQRKYLVGFTLSSSLLFLASWYQMVFGLIVIVAFVAFVFITNRTDRAKAWLLLAATVVAILTTLPLAKEYLRFSKANNASFSIGSQVLYSSGIYDYFTPYEHTPFGALYYKSHPGIQRNAYNSDNYSYSGVTLYALLLFCLAAAYMTRKKRRDKATRQFIVLLGLVFAAGFLFSLGPLIKVGAQYVFDAGSLNVVIPAPYILVDKFLPQLSFIRAVGRATIICLFALCCALAVIALLVKKIRSPRMRHAIVASLVFVVALDVLPIYKIVMTPTQPIQDYTINYTVPAVYTFIKDHKDINNLVILRTKRDYDFAGIPFAIAEDVLWAGYHNKNILNGYSGYNPPEYNEVLGDFIDLQADDPAQMKKLGLQYVLIDKYLSYPELGLEERAAELLSNKVYEDKRYVLYEI